MRFLVICLVLLATACADTVGAGGTVVELRMGQDGFGDPQVGSWELTVRPMRPVTFAEAQLEDVSVGGESCAAILQRHPEATGCVERENLQIDWDTPPLLFDVDPSGMAYVDVAFADPVFVSVSYPTAADSLCDWSGSERLLPGTTTLTIEVGVACE